MGTTIFETQYALATKFLLAKRYNRALEATWLAARDANTQDDHNLVSGLITTIKYRRTYGI